MKYLGVAYLIYLAVMTWRDRSSLVADETATPLSARRVIVTGVLINLLNPKLTIFFFAFLPLFVNPGQPDTLPLMLLLSGIFMAATFVVFALYGLFAAGFRTHVIRRPRVVDVDAALLRRRVRSARGTAGNSRNGSRPSWFRTFRPARCRTGCRRGR